MRGEHETLGGKLPPTPPVDRTLPVSSLHISRTKAVLIGLKAYFNWAKAVLTRLKLY